MSNKEANQQNLQKCEFFNDFKERDNNFIQEINAIYDKYVKNLNNPKIERKKISEIFNNFEDLVNKKKVINFSNEEDVEKRLYNIFKSGSKIPLYNFDLKKIIILKNHQNFHLNQLQTFYNMFKLMDKLWNGLEIDLKDLEFSLFSQYVILYLIVLKKFQFCLKVEKITKFVESLNMIKNEAINKRQDELLKFILRRFFNFLKNSFFKNTQNFLNDFYKKFLESFVSFEKFIRFFQIRKNKKKIFLKKFNNSIILMLCKNTQLKDIFLDFCQNKLIIDQKIEIRDKLFNFTKILREDIINAPLYQTFKKIKENLNNPKFYILPWSIKETKIAIQYIKKINNKFIEKIMEK